MARDRNITTLSNLEIVPDSDDPLSPDNGLYPPRLSQAQIDSIDVRSDSRGCLAYNTTTNSLQTVDKDSNWVNIEEGNNPSFSMLDVTELLTVGPNGSPTVTLDGALGEINAIDMVAQDSISAPYIIIGENTNNIGALAGIMSPSQVAPYTVTLGLGAGSGTPAPSYTMKGSLVSGIFTLTTGGTVPPLNNITVSALFTPPTAFRTLFNIASVTFNAINANAANLTLAAWGSVVGQTFTITQRSLTATTTYAWQYMVVGNIQGV